MAPIDLFFSSEDRHRVVLLQQALTDGGVELRLHDSAFDATSDPVLGVLSENAERWMVSVAVRHAERLIWLRLDDTPLPAPARQTLALQQWPGRSADLAVATLIESLQSSGARAGADAGTSAEAASVVVNRRRPRRALASRALRQSGAAGWARRFTGLWILLGAGVGIWLLTLATPDPASSSKADDEAANDTGTPEATGVQAPPPSSAATMQSVKEASGLQPETEAAGSVVGSTPTLARCLALVEENPDAALELLETLVGQDRLACLNAVTARRRLEAPEATPAEA